MDEHDAIEELRRIWELFEKTGNIKLPKDKFVETHIRIIRKMNNGKWNNSAVKQYLREVKGSL